ncbi:mucolipin-3-like isoform X4 [Mytilus californianus]|uniref:mucolipin-3-like isoform X4 n=1 Tax=Mytilus californianus TaxID=6549 RepID=UPI0022477064|nr:mucolipin-3-like isoform X4 [Mytilus californianus]
MATPIADTSGNGDVQKARGRVGFVMTSADQNLEDHDQHHSASEGRRDEALLKKLDNHFKDPYTRICRDRGLGRIPEKLILLPLVWFFCTYQLVLFGNDRAQFADFLERNSIAMKHLLLKDWSPDYETMPYPPSTGVYAIYTIDNLLEHINYTVTNVFFDNRKIDGQITVKLKTNVEEVKCNTDSTRNAKTHDIVISALVLLFCVLHGLFCLQGWITSAILFKKTKDYYNDLTGKILSTRACWEIFKLNDLILFLSHSITIVGSVIKISIDQGLQTKYIISMYDATGILLGLGCLFTWISVLHYLAYDHVFGLIFSVMEKSAFVVIKFLACVSILFAGFVLCAWAVVGPYHIKFASLTSTFQSLLALVNGDEIYVTFTAVDSDKEIVWFFNGFFLVVFLALFTLITLNIFIAIFNTAYEHQHDNEYKKDHRSDLLKFLGRMESKTFDTTTCASCVRHTCPSMLGCASFCDEDRYNRKSYQFNT